MSKPSFFKRFRLAASYFTMTIVGNIVTQREYWNEIAPGLYLGAMPIQTRLFGFGNHGEALIQECKQKGRPLKAVTSANEDWELEGYGFMGLKPVPSKFWSDKGVNHIIVPFADFGANIPVEDIKSAVEAIKAARKAGGSAYIHCKAGRGRSLVIAMCVLMEDEGINPLQAFEKIIAERPHISPSVSQLELVEAYRKKYLPKLAPLDLDHPTFMPYRKDAKGYSRSPLVHASVASLGILITMGLSLVGLALALAGGAAVKFISGKTQERFSTQKQNRVDLPQSKPQDLEPAKGWFSSWRSTYKAAPEARRENLEGVENALRNKAHK